MDSIPLYQAVAKVGNLNEKYRSMMSNGWILPARTNSIIIFAYLDDENEDGHFIDLPDARRKLKQRCSVKAISKEAAIKLRLARLKVRNTSDNAMNTKLERRLAAVNN